MASFTTPNAATNPVGRELSIASSFVKQYYTLLNKAPCFIHNFYSHDSTFIYGTIEMANEHYTEPIVGREKIKKKMEDLKLNDCRAKIKQIDCLETLAGGLVIQVVGELSNNGRPMRRFLQTFVLAPSTYDTRSENDTKTTTTTTTKSTNLDKRANNLNSDSSNSSSSNQKFFVLNSIFRYQDDGLEGEYEEDAIISSATCPTDQIVNKNTEATRTTEANHKQNTSNALGATSNGSTKVEYSQNQRKQPENSARASDEIEKISTDLEAGLKIDTKPVADDVVNREASNLKTVSNGPTSSTDRKLEALEKSNENVRLIVDQQQNSSNSANQNTTSFTAQPAATNRPSPSNEPKTWANMLRNSNPSAASTIPPTAVSRNVPVDQSQQPQPLQTQAQQLQQQTQQPQQQQTINLTLPTQLHHSTNQQQTQPQYLQQSSQIVNNSSSSNPNVNNNMRRRIMRKPSNKTNNGTRPMKNRPPRPTTMGKPLA